MQVVRLDGKGIEKMTDLKGKRMANGGAGIRHRGDVDAAPRGYGFDPNKDVNRERLSLAESVKRPQGRQGRCPELGGRRAHAGLTDLAATPGKKIKLLDHGDAADAMQQEIRAALREEPDSRQRYPGETRETTNVDVGTCWSCRNRPTRTWSTRSPRPMFEKKDELVKVHKDAAFLALDNQLTGGSRFRSTRERSGTSRKRD